MSALGDSKSSANRGRPLAFRNLGGYGIAAIVGLLLAAAGLWHSFLPLTADVAYFIVACGRILDGARPYVDIVETNPPLAFWLTLPPIGLARLAGFEPHYAYVVYFCSLIALSLLLTYRVCKSAGQDAGKTAILILAAAAVMTIAPAADFGQREHFAALLMFPYVAAAFQMAEGRRAGRGILILAGLGAGIGLSFKPYLLAIPVMVEVSLFLLKRDWRSQMRLELAVMAVPLAIYPAAVWWLTPEYLTKIVPLALLTYGAYDAPFPIALTQPVSTRFIGVAAGTAYLIWREGPRNRGGLVWIFAAAGSFIGYLAQSKGSAYHLLPGVIFAEVALLMFLAPRAHVVAQIAAAVFIGIIVVPGQWKFVNEHNEVSTFIDRVVGDRAPQRLTAFTHQIGVLFPYIETRKIEWGGSLAHLWMLPAVSRELIPAERRDAVVAFAVEAVTKDLVTLKPDYVIVDRTSHAMVLAGREIKYIEMFSRSPAFVQAWSHYRLVNSFDSYELWQLSD